MVVTTAGGRSFTGTTDGNGCAGFNDPALVGPVDVHYYFEGRPYESHFGVDAAEIAAFIMPDDHAVPVPPISATVSGVFTNFRSLTSTSATVARAAGAAPVMESVFSGAPDQPLRMGNAYFLESEVIEGGIGDWRFSEWKVLTWVIGFRGVLGVAACWRRRAFSPASTR